MRVTLHRTFHFNAAHKLYNPNWNAEQNYNVFGKCSLVNYHGHNYELIVSITGEIDKETGFVFSIEKLKEIVKESIEEKFDHKNLNIDIEEFRKMNPTLEHVIVLIWNILRQKIPLDKDLKITLYETPRNFAEYSGN